MLFHCSIAARQSYQSDFCYCSLTPPSALLLPPCAIRMAGQNRTKSAVPWPAGQAWDAILGDSTNRVMLAMPLAVSSSVSRPSQLLHTSCYTAGSDSMTVYGSMAVWWLPEVSQCSYSLPGVQVGRSNSNPKTCAWLPGRCKLIDSQLYQRQYEKYGSSDEDWFLICIFDSNSSDKILTYSCFSGWVKCWATSMGNGFQVTIFKIEDQRTSNLFCLAKMVQF